MLHWLYEAPEVVNREDSWSLLRHLGSQFEMPWVCIGDFHEIIEKLGGPIRPEKQMQSFRDCLDFCGLVPRLLGSSLHLEQQTIL